MRIEDGRIDETKEVRGLTGMFDEPSARNERAVSDRFSNEREREV